MFNISFWETFTGCRAQLGSLVFQAPEDKLLNGVARNGEFCGAPDGVDDVVVLVFFRVGVFRTRGGPINVLAVT